MPCPLCFQNAPERGTELYNSYFKIILKLSQNFIFKLIELIKFYFYDNLKTMNDYSSPSLSAKYGFVYSWGFLSHLAVVSESLAADSW